jgi:hypothetical protein
VTADRPLTATEHALAITLVGWLTEEMFAALEGQSAPGMLYDMGQSNYELGCQVLNRAGLLAADGTNSYHITWDRRLPVTLPEGWGRVRLDEALRALVWQTDYVWDFYPHDETVLPRNASNAALCRALADCGYMTETIPGAFDWAEPMGPWLAQHGAWPLSCFAPIRPDRVDRLLETCPQDTLNYLRQPWARHQADFLRILFGRYRNDRWTSEMLYDVAPSHDWDMSVAAGLYARLHRLN